MGSLLSFIFATAVAAASLQNSAHLHLLQRTDSICGIKGHDKGHPAPYKQIESVHVAKTCKQACSAESQCKAFAVSYYGGCALYNASLQGNFDQDQHSHTKFYDISCKVKTCTISKSSSSFATTSTVSSSFSSSTLITTSESYLSTSSAVSFSTSSETVSSSSFMGSETPSLTISSSSTESLTLSSTSVETPIPSSTSVETPTPSSTSVETPTPSSTSVETPTPTPEPPVTICQTNLVTVTPSATGAPLPTQLLLNPNLDSAYVDSQNDAPWGLEGGGLFVNGGSPAQSPPVVWQGNVNANTPSAFIYQDTSTVGYNGRFVLSVFFRPFILQPQPTDSSVPQRCTFSITWGSNTLFTRGYTAQNGTQSGYSFVQFNQVQQAEATPRLRIGYDCPAGYIGSGSGAFLIDTFAIRGTVNPVQPITSSDVVCVTTTPTPGLPSVTTTSIAPIDTDD